MVQKQWFVTRWRESRAVWWQSFPTEAEALEAAAVQQGEKS
jgi:hypothetical protein